MKTLHLFAVLTLFILSIPAAFAAIGQPERSVEEDSKALRGSHRVQAQAHASQLRVHEIQTDAQLVREYVNADGAVFAVTWIGLGEPSLEQLFGDYYKEYEASNRVTPTKDGRLPRSLRSTHLVVLKAGRMRSVTGKAYCPEFLPQGFNLKDIL